MVRAHGPSDQERWNHALLRLNARTKKDAFPLPRIDDLLNSLSGQAWFSTQWILAGKTFGGSKTKDSIRYTLGIIPICCNALRVVQCTGDI